MPTWVGLPWSETPCSEPTQYVYVVSSDSELFRFWPPTGVFTRVGVLACNGQTIQPFSMAIDRHAIAWVETYDSKVYRFDLSNGNCTDSGYAEPAGEAKFPLFGMAFVATPTTPELETLFVRGALFPSGRGTDSDPEVRWLGSFDATSATIQPIGSASGANSDLAGAGDQLFAFQHPLDTEWPSLIQIDKATGSTIVAKDLPGVQIVADIAVAGWGGDFWLFVDDHHPSGSIGLTTAVARYRPTTGEISWVPGMPFHAPVIGAGVSTCAPTTPPK